MLALKKKGFTLIEIVIVLAIAALILVIVFLAVSGAQRAQRDDASKSAAARLVAQYQAYLGDLPGGTATNRADITASYISDIKDARGVGATNSSTAPTTASQTFVYRVGGSCTAAGVYTDAADATGSTSKVAVAYYSEAKKAAVCVSN